MADAFDVLVDDRALVERAGNIMRGGAGQLDAALVALHQYAFSRADIGHLRKAFSAFLLLFFSSSRVTRSRSVAGDLRIAGASCWHLLHTSMAYR